MVSIISLRYGYHPNEILSKPYEWRLERLKDITRYDSSEKLWDLKLTSMMHSPGTESGATKLSEKFRTESRELINNIRRANDEIINEEDEDILDGRMISVPDD